MLAARGLGGSIELSVTDDGPGLEPADLARVRQRFFRSATARTVSGNGLGLAIAEAVARAHGGELELASGSGAGVMARLRLPGHKGV